MQVGFIGYWGHLSQERFNPYKTSQKSSKSCFFAFFCKTRQSLRIGFTPRHARLMTLFVQRQTETVEVVSTAGICRELRPRFARKPQLRRATGDRTPRRLNRGRPEQHKRCPLAGLAKYGREGSSAVRFRVCLFFRPRRFQASPGPPHTALATRR